MNIDYKQKRIQNEEFRVASFHARSSQHSFEYPPGKEKRHETSPSAAQASGNAAQLRQNARHAARAHLLSSLFFLSLSLSLSLFHPRYAITPGMRGKRRWVTCLGARRGTRGASRASTSVDAPLTRPPLARREIPGSLTR